MEGEVCIANIGAKNQKSRRDFGLFMLALGLVTGVILLLVDAPPLIRAGLFLPLYLGFIGIFQAKEKT